MIRLTNVSYISMVTVICVFLHVLGSGQCYGEDKTPKKHLLKEGWSPNIIVRYYVDGLDIYSYYGDIWLYSKKEPSEEGAPFLIQA
ncbi:MAG: hypothetical protein H7843_04600 [Nitrospirota bacterium]